MRDEAAHAAIESLTTCPHRERKKKSRECFHVTVPAPVPSVSSSGPGPITGILRFGPQIPILKGARARGRPRDRYVSTPFLFPSADKWGRLARLLMIALSLESVSVAKAA